jgi:hypothetical protein
MTPISVTLRTSDGGDMPSGSRELPVGSGALPFLRYECDSHTGMR